MRKPEDHLVHTADLESATLALSELTGLSRLSFELQRLAAGSTFDSPPGAERFLYVLEGIGTLSTTDDSADLGPGDFVALTPNESGRIATERGISCLLGRADG